MSSLQQTDGEVFEALAEKRRQMEGMELIA